VVIHEQYANKQIHKEVRGYKNEYNGIGEVEQLVLILHGTLNMSISTSVGPLEESMNV
jgi:hypothetical protein